MRIFFRLVFCFIIFISHASTSMADTIIMRDNVFQLIGSIIHQTSEVVVINVKTIPIPIRRSDIAEIIVTGGQPQFFGNSSVAALNQNTNQNVVGFESGSTLSGISSPMPLENATIPLDNSLSTSGLPYPVSETPTSEIPIPIESQPYTGFPDVPISANTQPDAVSQPFSGFPNLPTSITTSPEYAESNSGQSVSGETPSNQPMLPVVVPTGKAYQVSGVSVRFREGPSLDYPIVSTLPGKSVLLEQKIYDGWLHAKTLDGTEGWIHLNFVQPMLNQLEMAKGDNVHVRESAGDIHRSLARLRRGDIVVKLDETPGWHFILINNAVAGWTSAEFLQPVENPNQLNAPMRMVNNETAGLPVIVERIPGSSELKVNFTVRDDNIVSKGKTKICILRKSDPNAVPPELNYVSEAIFQRQKLNSSADMLTAGFPEALAVDYTSMDILTMLGARTTEGWQYSLTISPAETCSFAFVVQEGSNRGVVVLIP